MADDITQWLEGVESALSTAESANVFDQLEMLSGQSRTTHTGRDGANLIIFSPINIADLLTDAAYLLDGCRGRHCCATSAAVISYKKRRSRELGADGAPPVTERGLQGRSA